MFCFAPSAQAMLLHATAAAAAAEEKSAQKSRIISLPCCCYRVPVQRTNERTCYLRNWAYKKNKKSLDRTSTHRLVTTVSNLKRSSVNPLSHIKSVAKVCNRSENKKKPAKADELILYLFFYSRPSLKQMQQCPTICCHIQWLQCEQQSFVIIYCPAQMPFSPLGSFC